MDNELRYHPGRRRDLLQGLGSKGRASHGDDDQVVPYTAAALLQAKLLRNCTLKIYEGLSHGMLTTNADAINSDILAFVTN
jgi:pimeloyl-ACP methyl ester carboxylesterase